MKTMWLCIFEGIILTILSIPLCYSSFITWYFNLCIICLHWLHCDNLDTLLCLTLGDCIWMFLDGFSCCSGWIVLVLHQNIKNKKVFVSFSFLAQWEKFLVFVLVPQADSNLCFWVIPTSLICFFRHLKDFTVQINNMRKVRGNQHLSLSSLSHLAHVFVVKHWMFGSSRWRGNQRPVQRYLWISCYKTWRKRGLNSDFFFNEGKTLLFDSLNTPSLLRVW